MRKKKRLREGCSSRGFSGRNQGGRSVVPDRVKWNTEIECGSASVQSTNKRSKRSAKTAVWRRLKCTRKTDAWKHSIRSHNRWFNFHRDRVRFLFPKQPARNGRFCGSRIRFKRRSKWADVEVKSGTPGTSSRVSAKILYHAFGPSAAR